MDSALGVREILHELEIGQIRERAARLGREREAESKTSRVCVRPHESVALRYLQALEASSRTASMVLPAELLPRKSGEVWMKSVKKGNWSWREVWCVLRTELVNAGDRVRLVLYSSRESVDALGSAALSDAEVNEDKSSTSFTFILSRPQLADIELCARTAEDRERWVASLRIAIDFAKRELQPLLAHQLCGNRKSWIYKWPIDFHADDALNCQAFGPGLHAATCGERATVTIATADERGKPVNVGGLYFTARLESDDHLYFPAVRDLGDGSYDFEYVVSRAGDYKLSVLLNDDFDILGSPFPVRVAAAVVHAPSSTVKGSGISSAVLGKPINFEILMRDRFGNHATTDEIDVRLNGSGRLLNLTDGPGGSKVATYQVDGGEVSFDVLIAGAHCSGSPFIPVLQRDPIPIAPEMPVSYRLRPESRQMPSDVASNCWLEDVQH